MNNGSVTVRLVRCVGEVLIIDIVDGMPHMVHELVDNTPLEAHETIRRVMWLLKCYPTVALVFVDGRRFDEAHQNDDCSQLPPPIIVPHADGRRYQPGKMCYHCYRTMNQIPASMRGRPMFRYDADTGGYVRYPSTTHG